MLMIDEVTSFTEDMYRFLRTRVRMAGVELPEHHKECFPRIIVSGNPGNIGHCVNFGEVLTPGGWVDIRDFRVGDDVYTVDSSRRLIASKVEQVHRSFYDGDLIEKSNGGFYFSCTPNHKIARFVNTAERSWQLTPFEKLPGQSHIMRSVSWQGDALESFTPEEVVTRKRRVDQPKVLSGDDYLELLGWMLTEGCCVDRDKAFFCCSI